MKGTVSRKANEQSLQKSFRAGVVLIALSTAACSSNLDVLSGSTGDDAVPIETATATWQATVLIETGSGHGTGAIIGETSVLTAYHVVDQGISGIEFFGREHELGEVVWFDRALDVAIVRVNVPDGYRAAELYCGELSAAVPLLAVGHPLTERWVSVEGHLGENHLSNGSPLLSLDFELSLGNSGGPVFDQNGKVVGIATSILVPASTRPIPSASMPAGSNHQSGIGLMLPASQFCERAAQPL